MRDTWVKATQSRLERDPRLALILADIGVDRFRRPVRGGRVINVGIREALAVGMAAGLALEGFRPILHTYAPFLVKRAFEQIELDLVHQELPALLVSIGASFDAASAGRTHQAPNDVALLSTLGVTIEVPGHPGEVEPAMGRLLASDGVGYLRLSEQSNPAPLPAPLTRLRQGSRGTVLVIGPLLGPALEAVSDLDIGVVYTSRASPLPLELRDAIVPDSPLAVLEPVTEGTSLPAVYERLGPRPVHPIGIPRRELRRFGTPREHGRAHGLDARSLRGRFIELFGIV